MPAPKKYDPETQAWAVRMYADRLAEGVRAQARPLGNRARSREERVSYKLDLGKDAEADIDDILEWPVTRF